MASIRIRMSGTLWVVDLAAAQRRVAFIARHSQAALLRRKVIPEAAKWLRISATPIGSSKRSCGHQPACGHSYHFISTFMVDHVAGIREDCEGDGR